IPACGSDGHRSTDASSCSPAFTPKVPAGNLAAAECVAKVSVPGGRITSSTYSRTREMNRSFEGDRPRQEEGKKKRPAISPASSFCSRLRPKPRGLGLFLPGADGAATAGAGKATVAGLVGDLLHRGAVH